MGCHALLQGIFPTQGSNPCLLHLLHWQPGSLPLVPSGKPWPKRYWTAKIEWPWSKAFRAPPTRQNLKNPQPAHGGPGLPTSWEVMTVRYCWDSMSLEVVWHCECEFASQWPNSSLPTVSQGAAEWITERQSYHMEILGAGSQLQF